MAQREGSLRAQCGRTAAGEGKAQCQPSLRDGNRTSPAPKQCHLFTLGCSPFSQFTLWMDGFGSEHRGCGRTVEKGLLQVNSSFHELDLTMPGPALLQGPAVLGRAPRKQILKPHNPSLMSTRPRQPSAPEAASKTSSAASFPEREKFRNAEGKRAPCAQTGSVRPRNCPRFNYQE